jgi:hypothetical protein
MPRNRPIVTYPLPQFMALVTRILDGRGAVTIPCTPTQAASMRGELYAWRVACEQSPEEARSLGVPVERLREVAFRIRSLGLEVVHQSTLQTPALIEAALGTSPALVSPAQKALDRLRSLGAE